MKKDCNPELAWQPSLMVFRTLNAVEFLLLWCMTKGPALKCAIVGYKRNLAYKLLSLSGLLGERCLVKTKILLSAPWNCCDPWSRPFWGIINSSVKSQLSFSLERFSHALPFMMCQDALRLKILLQWKMELACKMGTRQFFVDAFVVLSLHFSLIKVWPSPL